MQSSRPEAFHSTVREVRLGTCLPGIPTITLRLRYPVLKLVEINSHSLFSRWFSESGKLVQKLFAAVSIPLRVIQTAGSWTLQVTEMVEEENTFVVLLIGELIESNLRRSVADHSRRRSRIVRHRCGHVILAHESLG